MKNVLGLLMRDINETKLRYAIQQVLGDSHSFRLSYPEIREIVRVYLGFIREELFGD
jgi:hypothetical protein